MSHQESTVSQPQPARRAADEVPAEAPAPVPVDALPLDGPTVDGLGTPPARPILTLPPLDELGPRIRISPNTGQPRRHPVMVAANVFLYGAAAVNAASLITAWWRAIHIEHFPTATRLIELINPRPGSLASIITVVGMVAIGLVMVTVPALAAFNSWNGHRWSRIAALLSIAVGALAWFMNDLAWWSIPPAAIGALLLWLPPVGQYFTQWELFRGPESPPAPTQTAVVYGPLPRYL